jgi:cytochrome oxidase Cu insertion factor (SCO1/SenC/PrrC family)/thiol-disulfide isomerase/thioredoxin
MASRRRTGALLLLLLLTLGLLLGMAPAAWADGDPGSDVLVYQPLFLASDSSISVAQQIKLNNLISASTKAGLPVRVAIIARPADLGTVTPLWNKPKEYAQYLGYEISLSYSGRLLVVMPNGVGFYWNKHATAAAYRALARVPLGSGPALAQSAAAAVRALDAAAHITLRAATKTAPAQSSGKVKAPSRAPTKSTTGQTSSGTALLVALLVLLVVLLAVALGRWAFRHPDRRRAAFTRARGVIVARRLPLGAATGFVLLVAVALAVFPNRSTSLVTRWSNPLLDQGTALSGSAPGFTLTNQFGQQVSLSAFRGKVVILAFTDSECTSMCPMMTAAMLDAKAMLGSAGSRVQLLGIDANPRATAIDDVLSYSQVHGMLHAWDFLTGDLPALRRAWKSYSITATISLKAVDHTPAIFVISPQGRLVREYITQQSYAAVGQLGQLLAHESSGLLPGRPVVHSKLSYKYIPGIYPTSVTQVPRAGGGRVTLGPGKARLLLFFATWDRQITDLAGGLDRLNAYQKLAKREGLPPLTAIDEGAVEPPGALTPFLRSVPGPLSYPVAIDRTGRIADGYEVEYEPFLELVSKTGQIAWYYSVSVLGWPSTEKLVRSVRGGLRYAASHPAGSQTTVLSTSPPKLASLQSQGSELLGGFPSLMKRIRALRGYPVVVNIWASWCIPCQSEFGLLRTAATNYGDTVAFLGADANDSAGNARSFLHQHHVSYPSYSVQTDQMGPLAQVAGVPTTIYINAAGKVVDVHNGEYTSQKALNADIADYTGS